MRTNVELTEADLAVVLQQILKRAARTLTSAGKYTLDQRHVREQIAFAQIEIDRAASLNAKWERK